MYVKVTPVDNTAISATSATQKFAYGVEVETVDVKLYFKSSSSYRYVPQVTVGDTTITMTKDGKAISKNASQTQSYYWYTATVSVSKDVATEFTFKNSYSMVAKFTVTESTDKTYYLGVDNLNQGSVVVDLTGADEYVRNFVKSASHMVYKDVYDAGVATTSIAGTIYKMGDADEDNTLSVLDATTIQLALAEKTELSEVAADLADYDLDGATSVLDATKIQIYLANS